MKKSVALASASALGLGMVTFGGAGSAVADDTTALCDSPDDYGISQGTAYDNWFMDCVPQFGVGKAEFSVTSAHTLPGDFLEHDDPGVTVTYSGNAAGAAAYFGVTGQPAGFASLSAMSPLGASQDYEARPIIPITGVSSIPVSDLPALACAPAVYSFGSAYQIDYAATTFTFTQTAGGYDWSVTVSSPAQSAFIGFTIIDDGGTNVIDYTAPGCLVVGGQSFLISSGAGVESDWLPILNWLLPTNSPIDPITFSQSITMYIDDDNVLDLGDFPLIRSEILGDSGLADTGADVSPIVIGAGATAFLAGIVLFVVSRLQRRRRDTA